MNNVCLYKADLFICLTEGLNEVLNFSPFGPQQVSGLLLCQLPIREKIHKSLIVSACPWMMLPSHIFSECLHKTKVNSSQTDLHL